MARHTISVSVLSFLFIFAGCNNPIEPSRIPGGEGTPRIEFTSVPQIGTSADLEGRVLHVEPSKHRVSVFINAYRGWWIKPHYNVLTTIKSDGTWTTDITTGGSDHCAIGIIAYLVTENHKPVWADGIPRTDLPIVNGVDVLAVTETSRPPCQ